MEKVNKQQVYALFGKRSGNVLLQILNNCCPILEYKIVLSCTSEPDVYQIDMYVKSSIALNNAIIHIFSLATDSPSAIITASVNHVPSGEWFLFLTSEGELNMLSGGTFIQTNYGAKSSVVIPEVPICTSITLDSVDIPGGIAEVSIVNGYENIIVEYSYDGGVTWDGAFGTEGLGTGPKTGSYTIYGPILDGIVLRAKVKNNQGQDVYSDILP